MIGSPPTEPPKAGPADAAPRQTPRAPVHTTWDSRNIRVRRTVTLPDEVPARPALRVWHDEDAEFYLNGQLVAELGGVTTDYKAIKTHAATLRPGANVIANHRGQTTGCQFIACGLETIVPGNVKPTPLSSGSNRPAPARDITRPR